jgi:hypothetical protein
LQLRLGVDDDRLQASHQPIKTDTLMLHYDALRGLYQLQVESLLI